MKKFYRTAAVLLVGAPVLTACSSAGDGTQTTAPATENQLKSARELLSRKSEERHRR